MKTAQKMITKKHKKQAKKNLDTFFLRAKTEGQLIPRQGAQVANYLFSTYTLSGNQVSNMSYINNAEFNLYRLQFDKFRVNSVTVKIIPKANVLDATLAQTDSAYNLVGDGLWHTVIDRDGNGPSNIAALSRYPSYRKFDVKKPWSRTYSIKYPMGIWMDCQAPANFALDHDLGLQGGITLYAENFVEDNYELYNEPVAQIECYYNIVFQGKTSNSLAAVYDAGGNVLGMTILAQENYTPAAQTPTVGIRGTLAPFMANGDTRLVSDLGADTGITELPITDTQDQ